MMLNWVAVNVFAVSYDDVVHNWYLYQRPIDGKWFMTPWDADGTFGDPSIWGFTSSNNILDPQLLA
jgi:spore coat protein CotH